MLNRTKWDLAPIVRPIRVGVALALAGVLAGSGVAWAQPAAPDTAQAMQSTATAHNTVTYDRYSLKLDGKRVYIWSGEFQYWRLPSPSLWRDVLQKMKAAGFNTVTIYFDWGYHSPKEGVYDFTGVRDIDQLLDIAKQVGIYVIARPGPYINAETDSGGFPGWLSTMKGQARSDDPEYTAAYMQWLTQVDKILARHQWTNGTGTVILYQIENELYDGSPSMRKYMQDIEQKVRADGITVPFSGNHNGTFISGVGAVQVPGWDDYPQGFDCTHPERWNPVRDYTADKQTLRGSPLYFPEFQGGAFDPWGGPGYAACRKLTGPAFERVFYEANIAAGSTMQSFYMTYGGTSWGWLAFPGVYTSYDYGAPIDESRQLTSKYYQDKLLGYFVDTVEPLTKTVRLTVRQPTDAALRLDGRINPDDGTQVYVLRHADSTSESQAQTRVWLDLGCVQSAHGPAAQHAKTVAGCATGAPGASSAYVLVPQQPGTQIALDGRDSKLLLAGYHFGGQLLDYSTSQFLTDVVDGDAATAIVYGRDGDAGETALAYASAPTVRLLSGQATWHWDAAAHRLRINYVHAKGTIALDITSGTQKLLLLAMDRVGAERVWKLDTAQGAVLAIGPYLVRTAGVQGDTLQLTGDTSAATSLQVFAPRGVSRITWNGQPLTTVGDAVGALTANLAGPAPVTLPELGAWKFAAGAPEIAPTFNDSRWRVADLKSSNNPNWNHKLPVLFADDYGFHYGDVWYRGHFVAKPGQKGILLRAGTGKNGVYTAWLNGHYLGRATEGSQYFNVDPADLRIGRDNVLSVLVSNMGHNEDWLHDGEYKQPRGLVSATWLGASAPIEWRIQGARGGEDVADPVRGPFNNGGLYGERHGWSLPGFPDGKWHAVALPNRVDEPGVDWYRTTFTLALPRDQDVPVALKIEDAPNRHYRALIFINGWQFGRYVNALGPQHEFVLPPGILNPDGENTIAIASWSTEHSGGLGKVSLVELGNYRTALHVEMVKSPGCKAYAWCGK
ncbi:MAG TPA: beta-galactosidase [Rhodanobacteraceae bacterium]|nr:beta-galactosidase [Rhodanobacteraceae bacterium]